MTTPTSIEPDRLPATIRGFLTAHEARDTDTAVRAFGASAVVVDEGRTFRGTDEILEFLSGAGAEFTYTTELIGAQRIDETRWVATHRLEGDFPGGVAELDYRFTMGGDRIAELVIAPRDTAKPTIVLVHGAFADSSSWNGVIARLRGDGYPVIGVANPLRGLHSDAEFLRGVLDGVGGPMVIAGHSYGGSVMSEAADGNPEVRALVYIASFLLDEGESTGELAGRFPGNELGPALRPVPVSGPDGQVVNDLYIQQERFREVFAADVPPDVADLMAVTQRPVVADALEGKAVRAAWKTVPSWTMVTLQDLAVPARSQRFMAERAGSHITEVDASHAVTVSRPGAVAELIDAAARATAD